MCFTRKRLTFCKYMTHNAILDRYNSPTRIVHNLTLGPSSKGVLGSLGHGAAVAEIFGISPDGKHGPALSQLSQRQFAISDIGRSRHRVSVTEAIARAGRRGRKAPGIGDALLPRRANLRPPSQRPVLRASAARPRARRASSGKHADQQKRAPLLNDLDSLGTVVIHSQRSSISSFPPVRFSLELLRCRAVVGLDPSPTGNGRKRVTSDISSCSRTG
jgi:hypothetical protein